jgi:hypothetical protein
MNKKSKNLKIYSDGKIHALIQIVDRTVQEFSFFQSDLTDKAFVKVKYYS